MRITGTFRLALWEQDNHGAWRVVDRRVAKNVLCSSGLDILAAGIGYLWAANNSTSYIAIGNGGVLGGPPLGVASALAATVSAGSTTMTTTGSFAGAVAGMVVSGADIPAFTTVSQVISNTDITLSAAAAGSATEDVVIGTSASDTTLYNEIYRQLITSYAAPSGFSQWTWSTTFPANTGGSITEIGVFLNGNPALGSGQLLDHAVVNPLVTKELNQLMTAQVTFDVSWA